MALPEILAELAAYVGDDPAKKKEVATALRKKARDDADPLSEHTETLNGIAQVLLDAGAGKKSGETATKVAEKQAEIDRLTGELEAAQAEVETAKKAPTEQQAAWDREKAKLIARAEKAEGELDTEREGRTGDRVLTHAERVAGHLKGRVDDDYLADVLAGRIAKRLRPAETGIQFLGEDDEPLDGDEREAAKALAEHVFQAVPDKYRLRPMNAGGGASGGGEGGGYDPVAAGKAAAKEQKGEEGRRGLAFT